MAEQEESVLQVLDGNGDFCKALSSQITQWDACHQGVEYSMVSVLGAQSSGKSTLLNHLFGTSFEVMDDLQGRSQTTVGVWLGQATRTVDLAPARARRCPSSLALTPENADESRSDAPGRVVFILDCEGTDSRERGEDATAFEQKFALFALALTEVLIINVWEHDVGRYNAANYALLKSVFEANLRLFQRPGAPKTLLLFVIRDHVRTPLERLESLLGDDLERIWGEISKPPSFTESKLADFFDIAVTSLPHYHLQQEEFHQQVVKLRRRFSNPALEDYCFQQHRLKSVPIDGLAFFAQSLWTEISSNRDLDLPSQREMLAVFRCGEILEQACASFTERVEILQRQVDRGRFFRDLGDRFLSLTQDATRAFDKVASRYDTKVYDRKRGELRSRTSSALKPIFLAHLQLAKQGLLSQFKAALNKVAHRTAVAKAVRKRRRRSCETIQTEKEAAMREMKPPLTPLAKASLRPNDPATPTFTGMSPFAPTPSPQSHRIRRRSLPPALSPHRSKPQHAVSTPQPILATKRGHDSEPSTALATITELTGKLDFPEDEDWDDCDHPLSRIGRGSLAAVLEELEAAEAVFGVRAARLMECVLEEFDNIAHNASLPDNGWTASDARAELEKAMATRVEHTRTNLITAALGETKAILRDSAKAITLPVRVTPSFWDDVRPILMQAFEESVLAFHHHAQDCSVEPALFVAHLRELAEELQPAVIGHLRSLAETAPNRMRKRFNRVFKYKGELPRIWKRADNIDLIFKEARSEGHAVLEMLSSAVLPSTTALLGSLVRHPELKVAIERGDKEKTLLADARDNETVMLITPGQQEQFRALFNAETDNEYVQAKTAQSQLPRSEVSLWLVVALVVLGMNELAYVLVRPPLLIAVALGLGALALRNRDQTLELLRSLRGQALSVVALLRALYHRYMPRRSRAPASETPSDPTPTPAPVATTESHPSNEPLDSATPATATRIRPRGGASDQRSASMPVGRTLQYRTQHFR